MICRRCHRSIWLLIVVVARFVLSPSRAATEDESPEAIFRRTVDSWQEEHAVTRNDWTAWHTFTVDVWQLFDKDSATPPYRLELVGALEEGILVIEKVVFQQGQGDNPQRDAALSKLYTTYAQTLSHLTPQECHNMALDPHTLLIGAETVDKTKAPTDAHLCIENAENSLRNAASLDATNAQAEKLLGELTGEDTVHKRKPKEFVAELFDSFADTFDDKLLKGLEYKVPGLVGALAQKLLPSPESNYHTVLDAGCGTGLAGRYIRPLMSDDSPIIGVDASQKMLDKADKCTMASGCGLELAVDGADNSAPLYNGLVKMDLEEMTVASLVDATVGLAALQGFDLIVAADVLVYFGQLDKILNTFAELSLPGARLIFSCELAIEEEAPLGWRLLASGRFAHTKKHAVESASAAGYSMVHYEEIVPRMEKGEAVSGHLLGFERNGPTNDEL